jgi:F-type H+-transporting ATPase subunit gamma
MTRRQDLEHHRRSLSEVRDIMDSMKTLAYMETRKLNRFVEAQHAVTGSIEEVAADFLGFHAYTLPQSSETNPLYLLIGTERGFCGDFNQALLHKLDSIPQTDSNMEPLLITVGHKLHGLLENDHRVSARIEGASVVEEVTLVLGRIVHELSSLQEQHGMLSVHGLFHDINGNITLQQLLPPFRDTQQRPPHAHPPQLNLEPANFLVELTEHYLFAVLYSILYASMMAENHNRVMHLEGVIKHLDDESDMLARQWSTLRQEEIIEEIEVILLSASSLESDWNEFTPAKLKHPPRLHKP